MIFANKTEMDMTSGSIFKKIVLFAWPLALSGWLQLLFSAADLITCGTFGSTNSVGAISATGSISYFIISLFIGFSIGANVVMGIAYGAKDKEKGERTIGTAYALALTSGIILAVFGSTCSRFFLEWMNTPSDIIDLSTSYMSIYFLGVPFTIIYNFGAALLRGMGDTKRPFYFLTIGGIANVGLNFLFVIVFRLDVAGVAITTVISQLIAATLTTISLFRNKGFARLSIPSLKFHKRELAQIIRIGLPAGIQSSLFSLSNVIIQSSVNSFGAAADTGTGAASNIESFLNTAQDSFAQAGVAFISANYGAKNIKNIRRSVLWAVVYGCLISAVLGTVVCSLAEPLINIYTSEATAVEIGKQKLYVVASTYVIFAIVDSISNAERGLGYSTLSMLISLVGICGLRIVYIYTFFQLEQFHSLFWLYFSYPLSWAVTALAHVICYFCIRNKSLSKCLGHYPTKEELSLKKEA